MKIILLLIFVLSHDLAIAKKEIVYDAFSGFYPYLGDSICRKKAFELEVSNMSIEELIKLWSHYEEDCSRDGSYQLILAGLYESRAMYLKYGHYDYKSVINILETSTKNANYDTRYHKLHLCNAYVGLGKKHKAKFLAEQMIKDYPNWFGGFYSLGGYYFNLKKYNQAKKYFDKTITLNDKYVSTYLMLGYIAYVLNEANEKVIEYYDKATDLDPVVTILDRRGCAAKVVVLINQGNFKEAKNLLEIQQEFDPEVCKEERFINVNKYYEEQLNKQKDS